MARSFNEADEKALAAAPRAVGGFHVATEWYFRGWRPLHYQYAWHHAPHMSTTALAGIAAGKTTMGAASIGIDCLTIPYFRALSTSVTASQAELTFNMFMGWVEGNKQVEHLIADKTLRPYPKITFVNNSVWEWRTAGIDARFIRGFEYDRILYDEAGLDVAGTIPKVLRGRLRGTRPDGTIRMARLDVITSPTDVPWLRERFERGVPDHPTYDPRYLSMRIETYDNTKLTPDQIAAMEADYPTEMRDVELRAMFPEYGFSLFPSGHVYGCIDQGMYDAVYTALNPERGNPRPGYVLVEDGRHGIIHFEQPYDPDGTYIMAGDPGTDNPPRRNSGVIVVMRVDVKPRRIVFFHWVAGKGSYTPFLTSFKYCIDKYFPIYRGLDATGPQKAIDELAFENHGIAVDGLNFGTQKDGMLNALSLDITGHLLAYPPIKGLIRQLSQYTREDDKNIPQDITMTLAMASYLARFVREDVINTPRTSTQAPRNRLRRTTQTRRR